MAVLSPARELGALGRRISRRKRVGDHPKFRARPERARLARLSSVDRTSTPSLSANSATLASLKPRWPGATRRSERLPWLCTTIFGTSRRVAASRGTSRSSDLRSCEVLTTITSKCSAISLRRIRGMSRARPISLSRTDSRSWWRPHGSKMMMADRYWAYARVWLYSELSEGEQ